MKNHLNEFKQKREEGKLSYSAYNNLAYNDLISSQHKREAEKISIIIPTHNRFKQLGQLIRSIFNQTYQNFEIILIDDVSDDETNEVYANYHDMRLKYFRNHENM